MRERSGRVVFYGNQGCGAIAVPHGSMVARYRSFVPVSTKRTTKRYFSDTAMAGINGKITHGILINLRELELRNFYRTIRERLRPNDGLFLVGYY
jgi:hypothetical protein